MPLEGVQLQVVAGSPLQIVFSTTLENVSPPQRRESRLISVDASVQRLPSRARESGELGMSEVLLAVAVDCGVYLFTLPECTVYLQHCAAAPDFLSTVALHSPVVTVCAQGDTNVYLRVCPAQNRTEFLERPYTAATTGLLKEYGEVSWERRVEAREPSLGARVIAQAPLYDRRVRTGLEG
ncbi:hypothetical protein JKF63_04479 [Porcisia hertigi]|uniref:Uncharacterized protein n=1 Tax=Porcisia hertigi TaxID=2761500 RepID=A0A836HSL2_9TRYP|nr:hypothetical protein JKF63_04479 [Porcisia hertigi]